MNTVRNRGVDLRLASGFGLAVLLLAVLGLVTFWNTRHLIDAATSLEHTRTVLGELDSVFSSLKDAETGQRGYLLTGLPSYLEPYRSAVATIGPGLERLRQLTSDNPVQHSRALRLEQLVTERLALLKANIDLRDGAGVEAAAAGVVSDGGKSKMEEIRTLVGQMHSEERSLLKARRTDTTTTARTAIVTLSLGGLLLFAFLGLIWALLRRDLLRRHQAEEELRRSEARLRTTLRSIGDAVIATDRNGLVTFLNPVAERLTGWSEAEATGLDVRDVFRIINAETRVEAESPIAAALREGAAVGRSNKVRLLSRTGAEYPIADSGAPIRDEAGEVTGVVLVFRDIAQDLRTESALQRLAALVASSEDAIVAETLEGIVTAWNAAAERLFGYSAAEMIGRPGSILEPTDLEENTAKILVRIRGGERVTQFDTTRVRKDGRLVSVSVSVSPILDADRRIVGASKIARDITERKEAEKALRAAKEAAEEANLGKDRFLAVLSHELRTPLTPALATAQVLERRSDLPPDVLEAIALVRRNVELQALLVDDLLDVTRIVHGKLELRREPLDLHSLIEGVVEICRSEILTKRLQVSLDLRAREHHAEADSARLQQVLWNVLKNAVKFTGREGTIHVLTENPAPGIVRIRVVDNGVGIAPELLDHVFEPFEQGIARRGQRHGGLGLGLSISKTLVELHGGAIRAESAGEGRGATFSVDLPAYLEKRMAPLAPPSRGAARRRSLSILLAEDHADTANALTHLLEGEGHRVCAVGTVAEAVSRFHEASFDFLITDLGLPDGSGHELMGRLSRLGSIPGIVLSGYGMDSDVELSRQAGFLDHLTKPVNIRKLLHVIDRLAGQA